MNKFFPAACSLATGRRSINIIGRRTILNYRTSYYIIIGRRTIIIGHRTIIIGRRTIIIGRRTIIIGRRTIIIERRTII